MNAPLATAAVAALLVSSSLAQGTAHNATLLARFAPPGETYNDVWGYAAPGGGEYAILGTTTATYIIDCSDPKNPVQRARLPNSLAGWSTSDWRDMRTYRHYCYVVSEGGAGCQIIDLANPDNPRFVKAWGQNLWQHAHNVALDTATGTLYPCGTDVGMPIVDLSADPENPTPIGTYSLAYVHDLCVQDGYAHLAEINDNRYTILDVRNLPTTTVLGTASQSFCHNCWPTRDDSYAVATTEFLLGGINIYDIRNKRLPQRVAQWRTGGLLTSAHNAFVKDRVVHMSYYSEGYRAVDISTPSQPKEVAYYDSSTSAGGFTGAWGCYPFQPSGVIYLSDIDNGLLVLDSKASTRLYGSATPGTGGRAPTLHTFGSAFVGNAAFAFEVEGAPGSTAVGLLLGAARSSANLGGLSLNVDLAQPTLTLAGQTSAEGRARFAVPLPAGLSAGTVYAQVFAADAAGRLGLAASRGLQLETFAP